VLNEFPEMNLFSDCSKEHLNISITGCYQCGKIFISGLFRFIDIFEKTILTNKKTVAAQAIVTQKQEYGLQTPFQQNKD